MKSTGIHFISFVFAVLNLTCTCYAGQTRTFFNVGLGDAVVKSASTTKATRKESPGAFSVNIDFPLSAQYYIFAEHFRSLGTSGSSVGFTGAGLKFYPWLSPQQTKKVVGKDKSEISHRGFLYYGGGGVGFSQASVLSNSTQEDALAAGLYVSLKAGAEYPLSDFWGLVSEWNYGTALAGSGKIEAVNLLFGAYFTF